MLAASSELPSNAKWSGGMLLLAAESDRDGNMGVGRTIFLPLPAYFPQSQACARATPQSHPPTTTTAYNYAAGTTVHAQSRVLRAVPHANTHTDGGASPKEPERARGVRAISPGLHLARNATLRSRPTTRGCRLPPPPPRRCARVRPACALPCPGGRCGPTTSRARSTRQQPVAASRRSRAARPPSK